MGCKCAYVKGNGEMSALNMCVEARVSETSPIRVVQRGIRQPLPFPGKEGDDQEESSGEQEPS